jgi:uncharacterized membrane protein YcfT
MLQQRLMWILWPAFLMAGVMEMLVFAMVDPQNLSWFGEPLAWSRQSVYTVAFFVFWVVLAVSGGLTTLLAMSPFEVNRCPLPEKNRADSCPKNECV